jgi:hypothetical protein
MNVPKKQLPSEVLIEDYRELVLLHSRRLARKLGAVLGRQSVDPL